MNASQVDPAQLQMATKVHTLLFQYSAFHIAGLCLLVWDFILTFDLEIEFFWSLRQGKKLFQFSTLRVLFFLNRYLPILTQFFLVIGLSYPDLSPKVCNIMIKHVVHIAIVIQWFAIPGAILCYRTCALYKGERKMVGGVIGCYLLSITISAFIVGFATKNGKAGVSLAGLGIHICHGIMPDRSLYAAFIPPILFDVGASLAAMYAITRHRQNSSAGHGSQLMSELAKGTVIWLLVVVASDILNLCIFAFVQVMLRHLFDGLTFAIISIASSRQLLHLRELGSARHLDETTSGASFGTLPTYLSRAQKTLSVSGSFMPGSTAGRSVFGEKRASVFGLGKTSEARDGAGVEAPMLSTSPISPASPWPTSPGPSTFKGEVWAGP